MDHAVNPDTGEVVFLVNNKWVPPAQIAQNDKGEKAYLVGSQWRTDISTLAPTPKESSGVGTTAADVGKLAASGAVNAIGSTPSGLETYAAGAAKENVFAPQNALEYLANPAKITNKIINAGAELLDYIADPTKSKDKVAQAAAMVRPLEVQNSLIPEDVRRQEEIALADALSKGKIQTFDAMAKNGKLIGQKIEATISPEMKQAMANTELQGNIFKAFDTMDFSEVSLGKDWSALGLLGQSARVLGSSLPALFTGYLTKSPTIGGVMEAGPAAAEAKDTTTEHISKIDHEKLMMASPYYADLIAHNVPPEKARELTAAKAGDVAAFYQGTTAMLGGEFTTKLITGAFNKELLGNARTKLGQITAATSKGAVTGATEGALQEVAEGVAADLGINKTVAREIGVDSFANLVLGAIGGGGTGTVAGAVAKPEAKTNAPPSTPPNGTQSTQQSMVVNPQGTLVPNPIPTTEQTGLFAPEALPASTATLTPDTLTGQTQAGKPVETEALQAPERAQAEIERNIFALQQQEQTPQVKEQIATLQEQLTKGSGETLDILKQEYTTLGNKGVAIQTQIQELTAQRDATPSMDGKLAITEQIKPLQTQLETITTRQQELLTEGGKLAKKLNPEKTSAVENLPLNLQGKITEDDFKTMKINKSNVKLREAILGKDLSDPVQRQEVIDVLNNYAGAPSRSAAMSTRIGDFINSISQETQNDGRTKAGVISGTNERSLQLPSTGVQATQGTTTPASTGVGSAVGTAEQLDGGAPLGGEAGTTTLAATPSATPLAQTTPAQAAQATAGATPLAPAQKAAKNSAGFTKGNRPTPKATFFRKLVDKLTAVREGNLNVGSLAFGNLQNFAANNQAFLNLMRKTALDKVTQGSLTMKQAKDAMLGLIGAQVSQRGQLSVQMMDNGNWTYDADTNTYTPIPDADNMTVFGDLIKQLAARLGVSNETAHTYMDQAIEANRLQGVITNLDKAKSELTRTLKRIEFLKNDIKPQRTPKGTKTALEQRAFNRTETARVNKAKDELKLKEALADKLKENISLYTDQAMHKDRSNIREGMELLNDHPEIQEGVRVWNVMRQRTIDFMVNQGLLTEEKAQQWMDEAAYVPFFRNVEASTEEAQQVMTKGLRETMAPLRAKYKGSMLEVASVTGNMRSWMQWALAGAISNGQINRMLDVYQNWLPEEVKEGRGDANNTFTVMQGGVERQYHVAQPEIANAFMQQAAYVIPLMQMAKTVSDIGRKSITRNPAFSLVQIPMDLYAAMFTSGIRNPGELIAQLFKEAALTTVDKSKTRKDLINKGLLNTHEYNAMTAEDAIKYAQDIVPPSYYRQAMNALDKFGAFSDNVIRQAVHDQLISEGRSKQEAETAAVEVINFRNKSGIKGFNSLSTSVLFFNSFLQQVAVILKTLSGKGITFQAREQGLKTLGVVTAKIFAFSFILAMINDAAEDEDQYAKRSRTAKNRLLGIPGTDGMGIPIREDLYALPKVLGDYTYRYLAKDAKDRGVDMKSLTSSVGTMLKNTFSPPGEGIPQLIKPTAEAALNTDIHTGRPIVPEHMKNLEPALQFNGTTAEYAKWLGNKTNTSPLHIDHLMKGYFGTTAQLMDMVTGSIIANLRDIPKPTESTRGILGKLPSIGVAFGKEGDQAIMGDYYEVKKDFDRTLNSYKRMAQTDEVAAEKYRKENEATMANPSGVTRSLQTLKRRENIIRNLPSREKNPRDGMTADEKAAEIKLIDAERSTLKDAVRELREKAYK
jgi:hypothetical protein